MRKLYIGSTAAFWTIVSGLWLAAISAPEIPGKEPLARDKRLLAERCRLA